MNLNEFSTVENASNARKQGVPDSENPQKETFEHTQQKSQKEEGVQPPKIENIQKQPTQQQMIHSLGSSLQCLFQKISKVCSQHELPSVKEKIGQQKLEAPSGPQASSPLTFIPQRPTSSFSRKQSPYSPATKENSFHSQKNGIFPKAPNTPRIAAFGFRNPQAQPSRKNLKIEQGQAVGVLETGAVEDSIQTIESKVAQKSNSQQQTSSKQTSTNMTSGSPALTLKERMTNKISSLFTGSLIRQVAASVIIEDGPKGQDSAHGVLQLKQFQIGKCIGSGKFGDVLQCKHKRTGTIYALKKIFKSTLKEYNMVDQFIRELRIQYSLNHPNIVKLYGHFSDEYHIFLLMEYAEGGTLMQKLKQPEEYCSIIVRQVIDAVEYLHSKNVLHRDIKPQNIVLTCKDNPKLCDFGWSALNSEEGMRTTFCGTLDYVSPQMKDKGKYGPDVDIWSIGVLTFELLVGHAPFKDEINLWKMKGAQRKTVWNWDIIYPPNISIIAQSFIASILKENPKDRASLRALRRHSFIRKYEPILPSH